MANSWFWILITVVPVLTAHKFHQSPGNTIAPEKKTMADKFPAKQHFFELRSAKANYVTKSIPITGDSSENENSVQMTEHRPTALNGKPDVKNIIIQSSTKPENKLEGISEYQLKPGNNYHTSEGIHSDTLAKNKETALTKKRNYMKQFLKISYKWSTYDENFDDALKELGVTNFILKAFVKKLPLTERLLENENNDGDWDYNLTRTTRRVRDYKFKLGVPLHYESPDKRQVTSTFTLVENNVLKEEQTWKTENRNMKATFIREYSLKKMVLKVTINNVTTVHTFVAK